MGEITVKKLNQMLGEIEEIHHKYGVDLDELRLSVKKGEYSISEPIVLIKEATLTGQ